MSSDGQEEKQQPTIRRRETPAFAPLPDEGGGYAAPQENSRGPLILALAIVVLVVFGVVVWNAYKQGVRSSHTGELPQIASEGAFKTKPVTPGGRMDENVDMQVLHQGGDGTKESFQSSPVGEEPLPLGAGIEPAAADDDQMSALQSKPPSQSTKNTAPQKAIVGRSGEPVDLQSMLSDLETSPPPTPKSTAVSSSRSVPKEVTKVVPAPKPTPTRKPAPKPAATTVVSGGYVVQLASVQNEAAVDTEWNKASNRAPELFIYLQKTVQTVDLGEKGVWHRIQAAGFESRDAANAFCASYKERGGDCIVKKK